MAPVNGTAGAADNIQSGKAYQGINIVSSVVRGRQAGYHANIWGTYKQWQEHDCQVRKGEKSSLVVFYKEYDADPDPNDESDDGKRRVAKASFAFNAEQVDGYTPPPPPVDLGPIQRIAPVDAFVAATKADIRHGGQPGLLPPVHRPHPDARRRAVHRHRHHGPLAKAISRSCCMS